ncbi:MAG: hypothetical protein IPI65_16635 [Bacteroidetes bacterium]|nr:hypothetical protein [Bacteroidota bacterium]
MDSIKHPKYYILIAALVTLFGIGGLGLGLMYFFHKSLFYQLLIHPLGASPSRLLLGQFSHNCTYSAHNTTTAQNVGWNPSFFLPIYCCDRCVVYSTTWLSQPQKQTAFYLWHSFVSSECRFWLFIAKIWYLRDYAHFWIDVVLMLYLKKAASKLKT